MSASRIRAPRIDHEALTEEELADPTLLVLVRLIWRSLVSSLTTTRGKVMFSTFLLIMVWGQHGKAELLGFVVPGWRGPGEAQYCGNGPPASCARPDLIPGIGWDLELVSFGIGFLLLVAIPCVLIRLWLKEPLAAFGLAWPRPERRRLALLGFLLLTAISLPAFVHAASLPSMIAVYPVYRHFTGWGDFWLYEAMTILFYAAIEFVFRGYLLFCGGRYEKRYTQTAGSFPRFALLLQMLSYTAWHLGKPLPELWGTLLWGITAGAVVYACRSVWPALASHWLLNVVMDAAILHRLGLPPFS